MRKPAISTGFLVTVGKIKRGGMMPLLKHLRRCWTFLWVSVNVKCWSSQVEKWSRGSLRLLQWSHWSAGSSLFLREWAGRRETSMCFWSACTLLLQCFHAAHDLIMCLHSTERRRAAWCHKGGPSSHTHYFSVSLLCTHARTHTLTHTHTLCFCILFSPCLLHLISFLLSLSLSSPPLGSSVPGFSHNC